MDILGPLSSTTSLIQQTFHLYRHISASRNFADTAGSYAVMIAVEYFRFEMWLQQSNLLTTDDSGNPTITDDAIRSCVLEASRQMLGPIDNERLESTILKIFGQVYHVLEKMRTLREKYGIDLMDCEKETDTFGK